MTDLANWLLAQIADDERGSSAVHDISVCQLAIHGPTDPRWGWECDCGQPARVLADCAAKRARVEHLAEAAAKCPPDDWPDEGGMEWAALADQARYLLLLEAQPYADRHGFDPAWRVG